MAWGRRGVWGLGSGCWGGLGFGVVGWGGGGGGVGGVVCGVVCCVVWCGACVMRDLCCAWCGLVCSLCGVLGMWCDFVWD